MSDAPGVLDPFSARGPKLGFLAGLDPETSVAVVGNASEEWRVDLTAHLGAHRVFTDLDAIPDQVSIGLIFLLPGPGDRPAQISRWLRAARDRLRDGGLLALLAANRLSPRRLLRHPIAHTGHAHGTRRSFRRWIAAAGFAPPVELTPVPSWTDPEEFVVLGGALGDALRDGFLYLAADAQGGFWRRQSALAHAAVGARGGAALSRFDLRERGGLLVMLQDSARRAYVCRVACTADVEPYLERNTSWLRRLHASAVPEVHRMVPQALGTDGIDGHAVHVEAGLPGTIAWRVVRRRGVAGEVDAALIGFLLTLEEAFAAPRTLRAEDVRRIIAPEGPPGDTPPPALARLRDDLEACLGALIGGTYGLGWAHGDFGYGNALVDPTSGRLQGVIDWDTGREAELVGVDLVNFLIQRRRIREHLSLSQAAARVGADVLADGLRAFLPPTRTSLVRDMDLATRQHLLRLVALRFYQRAARYPVVLRREQADLTSLLTWALTLQVNRP